jgi:hypothetical protein
MGEHTPGFGPDVPEEEREELRELVRAFRGVRFDANDVLARALNMGTTNNSGHVAQAIADLEGRGELQRAEDAVPPEWEFVDGDEESR